MVHFRPSVSVRVESGWAMIVASAIDPTSLLER